jgi:hypothetical protein
MTVRPPTKVERKLSLSTRMRFDVVRAAALLIAALL